MGQGVTGFEVMVFFIDCIVLEAITTPPCSRKIGARECVGKYE
jgi:hypothetical protein